MFGKTFCHLSKSEIITLLKKETESHVATFEEKHDIENKKSTRVLNVRSKTGSLRRIKTPANGWEKRKAKKKKSDELEENESVLQDIEDSNFKDKPQNEFSQENSAEDTVSERSMDNDDTLDYDYNECIGSQGNSLNIKGKLLNLIPGIKQALCAIKPKKWAQVQEHVLLGYFYTAWTLQKFVMQELKEITMCINLHIPNVNEKLTERGLKKAAMVNQLARVLGDGSKIAEKERKRTVIKIEPLKTLAQRAVMKKSYPKKVLNVSYCNFLWPEKKRQWLLKAHVSESITVHGVGELKSPFYVPSLTKDNDFEIGVYDKTHLGSNLRKTLSLDKLSDISKSAWTKVAEQNPDILNPTILEVNEEGKIIDQMKESLAKCLFTDVVEQKMSENGDEKEAKFCRIIREGLYTAEDYPGIPETERCRKRLDLINWLQECVDFGNFPPYGSRIKGMSYILYEGLRMSQESKLYLYALSKTGTYCVRSPNTLCSESFFTTMQEMDPWGQGVLSTDGVQKHISDFTAITALKMNENRSFYIRTKRDAAYPVHDIPEKPVQEDMTNDALTCNCREKKFISCIIPRDHFFDTQLRARTSRPLKRFKFADVNDPCRGDLPVRAQYGYRLNEAKILPSKRLALNLDSQ